MSRKKKKESNGAGVYSPRFGRHFESVDDLKKQITDEADGGDQKENLKKNAGENSPADETGK